MQWKQTGYHLNAPAGPERIDFSNNKAGDKVWNGT